MRALLDLLDRRTGLSPALRKMLDRPVRGGPCVCKVWPTTILFAFVVQVVTGFFLWIYYSPSAQSAWESVYFLQYEVVVGWLLRAVHHYSAQVMLVLIGIYMIQMLVTGAYRAPREFVFWTVVLMGLVCLTLLLTGDLLAWDQNSYASTQVRVSFLTLLPGIGGSLFKLAAGGPAFGHLTLTRFLALHIGLFAGSFLLLLILHGLLARRADAAEAADADSTTTFWPRQAVRNAVAVVVVMVVVLALSLQHGVSGVDAGVSLGAPADPDPANFHAAARPEWAFLGLYEFSHMFPGELMVVPIFAIPGLMVCLVLAMPWIARVPAGHWFNVGLIAVLLIALVALSLQSLAHDRDNAEHQAALAEGRQQADRVKQLAGAPSGIPVTGALTLLRGDPKTQGPRLCQQHCASCHSYTAADGEAIAPEAPSAPELYGFAGRPWIAGLMDPEKIGTAAYFGNTRFATGVMVRYVQTRFAKLKQAERDAIVAALSAEAQLDSQQESDRKDKELIQQGRKLIAGETCVRCHRYHGQGPLGSAPDLTGYGSREWLVGVVADASHPWLYGRRNDRMPAYCEIPEEPEKNSLSADDVALLADWLRGDWYEPQRDEAQAEPPPKKRSAVLLAYLWDSRRAGQAAAPATGPHAGVRDLFTREHCALCHDCTGAPGGDIKAAESAAPDLGGFASREWLAGLLDPKQIKTPKYFGNTRLRRMVGFVIETFSDLDEEEQRDVESLVIALSAEAALPAQRQLDEQDAERIRQGREFLVGDFGCTDCHKFHDEGSLGSAPDLTGYGSPEWLRGIIRDPQHKRFYAKRNDGMPSYLTDPENPQRNLLTAAEVGLLSEWLRGESDEP